MNSIEPLIPGAGGGSGSGKSTGVAKIVDQTGRNSILAILSLQEGGKTQLPLK